VSSEVKEVITAAVDALRGSVDFLEEGWPPGFVPLEQYSAYRILANSVMMRTLEDDEYEERRQALKQDEEFRTAKEARKTVCNIWKQYFETRDAFLLPTCFIPAFPHNHSAPLRERVLSTPEGDRPYLDISFWISFASFAGLPATIAPVGLTKDGLPVGIQIVGPHMEDATPIDLAAKISKIVGGFRSQSRWK
jgi:amidase